MKNHTNKSNTERMTRMRRAVLMIATLITAMAVAVVCALCFGVSNAVPVENGNADVSTSATLSNPTGDYTGTGRLNNGDVINYTSSSSVRSIKLPIGEYKFTVTGAAGGNGYGSGTAGKGGRTTATVKFTTVTTIYIVTGGKGADYPRTSRGSAAGGYNGGGTVKSNRSCSHGGGAGGGATHIATASGTLSSLSGNKGAVLIVAGGGGGAGNSTSTNYKGGDGGGTRTGGTGVLAGGNAGLYAIGGSSTGGTCSGSGAGASGGFGVGGNSTGRSNYVGGAGGGGGYYGGAGGAGPSTCAAYGGGGGSSYVKSTMTNAVYERGVNTGAGTARIDVINVNQKPVNANPIKTYTTGITRSSGSVQVKASEIALDPDTVKTTLYFTNGTASNLDTVTKTNSGTAANTGTGLYLNSACTTTASKYLNWTWASDAQINITGVKLYPRNGIDGCTQNGRLTLYAKVRDSYGTSGTQRGWNTIMFYVKVSPNTVSERTATLTNASGEKYYLGMSKTTTAPTLDANGTSIYNPNGLNRYTLIIEKALRYKVPFTIPASSLLGNVCTYDKVVMALNSTTAITGSARKFSIKEYDANTNRETAYNSSKVQIANAFNQLTFICEKPDPAYQVFSVTLYTVEKTTAYGSANPNTVADIRTVNLDIVFKMDNTRPVLKDTSSTAPAVTVKTLDAPTPVLLSTFYEDADVAITANTHQIKKVKVATSEYIQLDKYGQVVSTVNKSGQNINKSYFNIVPGNAATPADILADARTTGMLKGADYATGFQDWYISNGASNTAYIQYSFSGMTLNITGLRATHNMYKSTRETSRIATSGSDTTGLTCGKTGALNAGHFYILINVQDKNDTADEGIWLPLGITVQNAKPHDLSKERGAAGASSMPTAMGDSGASRYFTPMGITVDRVTYPIGKYFDGTKYKDTDLRPLAADPDNYFTTNMLNGSSIGGSGDAGRLNELVTLKAGTDHNSVQQSVAYNSSGEYFTVSDLEIYIPKDYFGGRVKADGMTTAVIDYDNNPDTPDVECVVIKGLKITLNNWTHNRYLYAIVDVEDSAKESAVVNIAINVTNIAPECFDTADTTPTSTSVAQLDYTYNGKTVKSTYRAERDSDTGKNMGVITYNVPMHSTIVITPYDLIRDANMTASGVSYPTNGFTLNGLNGLFDRTKGEYRVDDKKTDETKDTRSVISALAIDKNTTANGQNFGDETYVGKLKETLGQLQSKRTFASVSAGNTFGAAQETNKTTSIDRLYFERTSDGQNLDGYSFDPYANTTAANAFANPFVIGDSFVSSVFGSQIKFKNSSGNYDNNNTYNIDYIIITATQRTQTGAPAEIVLNIRDRMGAGASGTASGVRKIKVVINVINSTPTVQHDKIYTLTTDPLNTADAVIKDASETISVKPSTFVIYAANYKTKDDLDKNFLTDNEGDPISFYTSYACEIRDEAGRTSDPVTNTPYTKYIRASLTSETLTITALNSTQSVKTLYVVFHATDGRSSNSRDIDHSECKIKVEVENALPQCNNGEDGFEINGEGDGAINLWNVETINTQDPVKERYFVSSAAAAESLAAQGVTAAQIKIVAKDSDALQGFVLSPVANPKNNTDSLRGYYNVDRTAASPDYRSAVPFINPIILDNMPVSVLIEIDSSLSEKSDLTDCVESYEIVYFVDGNMYTATGLRNGSESVSDWDMFFDSDGRWKVTDWAVRVKPKQASIGGEYIKLGIMLRDENIYGGSTAGKPTSFNGGIASSVDGYNYIEYYLFINSIGIVPYTYYNQFDGYYTVADAQDSSVNYVPTYDGDPDSVYGAGQSSLYLDGSKISTTTGTLLKTRAENTTDGIVAGVHAGAIYAKGVDYTYDIKHAGNITANGKESAFKYSDTIKISADKGDNSYTYIPMSYFAMRKALVDIDEAAGNKGGIKYSSTQYVAYDIEGFYDRLNDYAKAITISDGTRTWRGSVVNRDDPEHLSNNPYVSFTSFDADRNGMSDAGYSAAFTGDYFNHCLAVPSIDGNGDAGLVLTTNETSIKNKNAQQLLGNGRIMYLADQASEIQENLFGIGIKKKDTRASAASLTMTIAVAQCSYVDGSGTVTAYTRDDADSVAKNTAKVTFKLEIGNSPITLEQSGSEMQGVRFDDKLGYYTTLKLNTSSPAATVALSRNDKSGADRTIRFSDDDKVVEGNSVVDERSDRAYFYYDSLFGLGSWSSNEAGYNRVKTHREKDVSGAFDFVNTAQDENAQKSMKNYFGSRNSAFKFNPVATSSEISNVDGTFQANGGIYGSNMYDGGNEGFSSYFGVSLSSDGSTLSITPNAKTEINADMLSGVSSKERYYNERGLEYDGETGYYPLKVLIYDSHGDGFMVGSYVALEIRVYIVSSRPTLSSELEDNTTSAGSVVDGKKISVELPVDQTYHFDIQNIVRSKDLLSTGSAWYWESDYEELKRNAKTKSDNFKLETGLYLKSPFADSSYKWANTNNADLIAGNAKLYDGYVDAKIQPDVVMFMDYDYTNGPLNQNSVPKSSGIDIRVNRRTTVDKVQIKEFMFRIWFTDSENHSTDKLTIYVKVNNKAPTIRPNAVANAQNLKMRVGDSFTVLTTPYDKFTGAADGSESSAKASTSYDMLFNNPSTSVVDPNLVASNAKVHYSDLTEKKVDTDKLYKLHNYDRNIVAAQHLGYLAIADDDTPWALRIEDVRYYDDTCFRTANLRDKMTLEGKRGTTYALDAIITADRVCENLPITITVVDGDGARATFTMYVTVESSMPSAIASDDAVHNGSKFIGNALLPTYDENSKEISGIYETYMAANSTGMSSVLSDNVSKGMTNVVVNDPAAVGGTRTVKNVFGKLKVNVNNIAYDPDYTDNANIALYSENSAYNVFMFNGMVMEKSGNTYSNEMFEIVVADDYQSFVVTCLTYDPYNDWDELSFYVRDCGNNIFENAIPVTIRISTLYSTVTNEHQSAIGKVTNGTINNSTVDNVYVKPYDDYIGVSADVQNMTEEDRRATVNVQSTYQFLSYQSVDASIDQSAESASWAIKDPDVVNNKYNLHYNVNVYALMDFDSEKATYNSMSLTEASALFDLSSTQLQKHYWYLKEKPNDTEIPQAVKEYFIGGMRAGGSTYSGVNASLNMFLQRYFVFDLGKDGVSLTFRPVTSNIDLDILFYVQIEKFVDSSRSISPRDATTKSGTIFRVQVKDSAPIANENETVLSFKGKINDSHIFPIYNEADPYSSMFTDSDLADVVSINGFTSNGNINEDYEKALAGADCDWRYRSGVVRAIDIEINNTDAEANGIPAHSLKVTIRRRIDKLDAQGRYMSEVELPIRLEGFDIAKRSDFVTLKVTIQNSDFDLNMNKLEESAENFDALGAGYSVTKDEARDRAYTFNTFVAPDSDQLDLNIVRDGWISDPDFTSMTADTDSFRLARPDNANSSKYLLDGPLAVYADGSNEKIATITPIFGNNGTNVDANHFAGFTVVANSYKRGITGTAYIRMIDRSGDETREDTGITITVTVTVLNAAPSVKTNVTIKPITLVGSDSTAASAVTIDINQYVEDKNGDKLHIVGMFADATEDIHCTGTEDPTGALAILSIAENTGETKCLVTPRKGFYGTQNIVITVADGDIANDAATRTAMFSVPLHIIYDFTQIDSLNNIKAIRSLPTKVTVQKLFPDIEDHYDANYVGPSGSANPVLTSDDEKKTFNPGDDYIIVDLKPTGANVTVSKDADDDWQFVCSREMDELTFNATFVRRIEYDFTNMKPLDDAKLFTKTFIAIVGKNTAPVLLDNFKRETGYTFHTRDGDYGLDSNGTVALTPGMLFSDIDIAAGDRLLFDPKVIEVVSPTLCSVRISDDGTILYLTFNVRGETKLTVGVKDRTGETVTETFTIKNIDRPEASFMNMIKISYETHPFIWLGVGIGLLAIILFIILLIILLKRRKRKREELEAILVSEMELEEQMMRLAGGVGSAPYQSYGYLPPTMNVQNDPNLMLGTGGPAPSNDAIGLNPGNSGDSGVSNDSDM